MKPLFFLLLSLLLIEGHAYDPVCVSHSTNLIARASYTTVYGYTEFIELFDEEKINGFTLPRGVYTPFQDLEAELNAVGNNIYCDEGAYLRASFNFQAYLVLSLVCKNDSGPSVTLTTLKLDCL